MLILHKRRQRQQRDIFPFRNVHSMNPQQNHTCARPFSVRFGPARAARYRSRNTDKSGSVMINEAEEGARETVTARWGYKCPTSTAEPFAEGVESIPVVDQLSPTH